VIPALRCSDQLRCRLEAQCFRQLPSPRQLFEQGTGPRPELDDASGVKSMTEQRDRGFVHATGIGFGPGGIGGRVNQAEIVSVAVHSIPIFRLQWGEMKPMPASQA